MKPREFITLIEASAAWRVNDGRANARPLLFALLERAQLWYHL